MSWGPGVTSRSPPPAWTIAPRGSALVNNCGNLQNGYVANKKSDGVIPPLAFYRPPAFSIALTMILFASSPERFVTVKCATDCRRRVFFFASTEISVICIATRGALRSIITMSRSFSLATVSPQQIFSRLRHSYRNVNPWRAVY